MRAFLRPSVVLLAVVVVALLGLATPALDPLHALGTDISLQELSSAPALPNSECSTLDDDQCLEALRTAVLQSAPRKDTVLSWPLVQLDDANAAFWVQGAQINSATVRLLPKPLRDLGTARMMHIDAGGSVQVFIRTDAPAPSLVSAVTATGANVQRASEEYGIIQAQAPISQLRNIATIAGVKIVTLPDYGVVQAGSETTEGDALMNAAAARSSFGIDGSGVRVGVISDGVEGLAASQGSGDLPSVNTATCNIFGGDPGGLDPGGDGRAEGTAMMEIVHDLAPGAELWFGHWGMKIGGTSLDFMAAVDCLAENVDIVVDDIGFYNVGPYDGTSPVSANASEALNTGANPIRGYYTAVGNDGQKHYEGSYVASDFQSEAIPDFWNLHLFSATSNTFEAGLTAPCSCLDTVALPPGASVYVRLQWDDAWGASGNDYDLLVFLSGVRIGVFGDPQDGDDNPIEAFSYTNNALGTVLLDFAIGNYNGTAAAREFDMFVLCTGCQLLSNGAFHNFNTPGDSVSNNADAGGGVVALGAINASDPGSDDIAPYSSWGPTNDGRMKPDASAIDGVSITGNGGFNVPFSGTSAAAPHAAGVAALLLDCDPSLTRTELRDALLNAAVDLGSAGPDNVFGHGRLDALAAATSVGCAGGGSTPTLTPTPSPSPTGDSAPTATVTPTVTAGATSTPAPTNASAATWTPVPTWTPQPTWTPNLPPTATPTDTPLPTDTPQPTNTPRPTNTRTPTPAVAAGDASCDGTVNPLDAALILQLAAGMIPALPCPGGGDANRDGTTNPLDAALVLQFSAGMIDSLPT